MQVLSSESKWQWDEAAASWKIQPHFQSLSLQENENKWVTFNMVLLAFHFGRLDLLRHFHPGIL